MERQNFTALTKEARIRQIQQAITEAANSGEYEHRAESLLPEQKEWLEANGFTVDETMRKSGTTYDIKWD